jgi:hypothetical protein
VVAVVWVPVASVTVTVAPVSAPPVATVPLTEVGVTVDEPDDVEPELSPLHPLSCRKTKATAAAMPVRTDDRYMNFPDAPII